VEALRHVQHAVSDSIRKRLSPVTSLQVFSWFPSNFPAENDIVLLKNIHNSASTPLVTNRLRAGKKIELTRDSISHDDILGKGIRDLVSSRKRTTYRIQEPTLDEYTDLSPRIVTPVS
jgi:tRNA (adenine57-N1/adenine58-N1)-methyltransferase catalytic subunit